MRKNCVALVPLMLCLAWLFHGVLWQDQAFAFRDGSHYYPPLFRWVTEEWSQTELPLWNPLENLGASQISDPTASIFYPGKILYLFWSPPTAFAWFTVGHLGLAGYGVFCLSRRWRLSHSAAGLAAVSYVLGGNVLIQYCNTTFLIGAAWLPWCVGELSEIVRKRSLTATLRLAIYLALMILGGDVQMVYHVGLLGVGMLLLQHRLLHPSTYFGDQGRRRAVASVARLASSGLLACGLGAVQLFPAFTTSQQSTRVVRDVDRSLFEGASSAVTNDGSQTMWPALAGKTVPRTHHDAVYQFSTAPWRWLELVWPNVGGRQYPENRRWMNAIPAEGRVWSPSLYVGLMPLILATTGLRFRRGTVRRRWLSWMTVGAIVASLGWYGLGWCWSEAIGAVGGEGEPPVGPSCGGLYWLMTVALPGYVQFRYPSKWWVIAQLGICLLAAHGMDGWIRGRLPRLTRRLVLLAFATIGLLLIALFLSPWMASVLNGMPPDNLFGPLDSEGATSDFRTALIHTLLVAGLAVVCVRTGWLSQRGQTVALIVLTSVELLVAQQWLVALAPRDTWTGPSIVETAVDAGALPEASDRPFPRRVTRRRRTLWWPPEWIHSHSPDRQREAAAWESRTLYPNHHLTAGIGLIGSSGAMTRADFAAVLHVAEAFADPTEPRQLPLGVLQSLQASVYLAPAQAIGGDGSSLCWTSNGVSVRRIEHPLPRSWIVHKIDRSPAWKAGSWQSLCKRTEKIWYPEGRLRDFRRSAVVESNADLGEVDDSLSEESSSVSRVTGFTANRVELSASLSQAGLLVINEQYDDGWVAAVTSLDDDDSSSPRSADVLRTNRIMRGVLLPPGNHQVVLRYRPRSFFWGAWVSGVAWFIVAIAKCRAKCRAIVPIAF